jgi:hypothetical protein
MIATQQFREDAKAGGCIFADAMMENELYTDGDMYRLLLMPEAWQAVGKTRGWEKMDEQMQEMYTKSGGGKISNSMMRWAYYWHRFIDHLAEGKSIEDSLKAIS